jgi:hypothetical protein
MTQSASRDFKKVVGDLRYELEIYPITVYYDMVDSTGKRAHQACIKDNKVDWSYVARNIKSGVIPFKELTVSKHATFESMMKTFTEVFEQPNYKKGRLLIGDQIISGLKLQQTMQDIQIRSGQLIYVEYLQPNNTWPTDLMKAKHDQTARSDDANIYGQTCGLYNLGNTCYMNSAL